MEKVIRDGKVAVLVSPGYGAGWYSWNSHKELLFHPKLVEMVEKERGSEITEEWVEEHIGLEGVYCGGASNLVIKWISEGTNFTVEEYDGSEYVITDEDLELTA